MISINFIVNKCLVFKAFLVFLFASLHFALGSRRQYYLAAEMHVNCFYLPSILSPYFWGQGPSFSFVDCLSETSLSMPHTARAEKAYRNQVWPLGHSPVNTRGWFTLAVGFGDTAYSALHSDKSLKLPWVLSYKHLTYRASLWGFATDYRAFQ